MRLVVSPSSSVLLVVEEVVDASALTVMLCNSVCEVIHVQTLGLFMSWITLMCTPKHFLGLLPVSRIAIDTSASPRNFRYGESSHKSGSYLIRHILHLLSLVIIY